MTQAQSNLLALADHWRVALPETFERLYTTFDVPFVSPCEFLALDEMVGDDYRWRGMLPQFLPFGQDGEENFFGFYLSTPTAGDGDLPVLAWDHEYDHYYPVSSGFDAFLRYCITYGRYLAQDSFEDGAFEEGIQREAFADTLRLPAHLFTEPLPRNDRELYERLAHSDPQNASALAQLGSRFFGRGDHERARDCFVRASEAAPWFSDPYYLLAESYRVEGAEERACRLWWKVFQSPIALSTRTSNYDLGFEHTECEIYEAAAESCQACDAHLDEESRSSPLWKLLKKGDPFASLPRLDLADRLQSLGDSVGVERELLNALTLATEDDEMDAAYDRLVLFYEEAGRTRDANLCRRDQALE